jgi:hypothetical protein
LGCTMADLGTQLRSLIDGAAEPITLEEVTTRPATGRVPPPPGRDPGFARRALWFAAAAVVVLASVGVAWRLRADGDRPETQSVDEGALAVENPPAEPPPAPTSANADLLAPGETRAMSPSPLAGRSAAVSVWTGEELIIWSGGARRQPFDDGAAYDPRRDEWRTIAPSPIQGRQSATAVWTGTEMIVWGGESNGDNNHDGAAYDPVADTWRTIAAPPEREAFSDESSALYQQPEYRYEGDSHPVAAVWTGGEMVVLRGGGVMAAYAPASDTWRHLAPAPGAPVGTEKQMVWTGAEIVAKLGIPGGNAPPDGVAYRYDLATDRWSPMPNPGFGQHALYSLVWDGREVIASFAGEGTYAWGFDPAAGTWRPIAPWPTECFAALRSVWTGETVLSFGIPKQAVVLDPEAGTWTGTPAVDSTARISSAVAWADGVLLVWGGYTDQSDGYLLRPVDPPPG